jgi:hypothetical protein
VNTKKYTKGGALKPVPSEKKGLSKLPTEVRNKMGYMMGGGKMGMMYQNGGKQDPPRKPGAVVDRNGRPISPMRREVEAMFSKFGGEAYPGQAAKTEKTFMANARAQEAINLNEMRNALKSEGPESLARFDKELKAKGYKVVQKPVKKMMGGGKLDMMYAKGGKMDVHDPKGLAHVGSKGAKAPLSTPYNKTKDNNSYISNDVDMSPAIKKQMMALRQAMMYFTGVSPKNK